MKMLYLKLKLTMKYRVYKGYTLIELVISMSIIAISLIGTLMAINMATLHSGDPLLRHQAIAIAESYLEEISQKDFPVTPCPSGTRGTFTNICNYNGLSEPPTNQNGIVMSGLGGYTVSVAVDSLTASLGSPSLAPGKEVIRIDVTVSLPPIMVPITLSTYRTNY
jgi:MSHA pilin protein MshD